MSDARRLSFFLPNIFTALNIGCGFMAIVLAAKGEFERACLFIVFGALFDLVDGRIARLTGTSSQFGEQFDSLSDLISFGMAPSLVYYFYFLKDMGRVGVAISFMYLLAGALRLARFNAKIDSTPSNYFQGLPIPGAATAIVCLLMVHINNPFPLKDVIAATYMVFYSVLMISSLPFTSFKKSDWVKKNKKSVLALIFFLFLLLFIFREIFLGILITLYVFVSIAYFLMNRKRFKGIFDWDDELESDL